MNSKPRRSSNELDRIMKLYDLPGVHVIDGSLFPTSLGGQSADVDSYGLAHLMSTRLAGQVEERRDVRRDRRPCSWTGDHPGRSETMFHGVGEALAARGFRVSRTDNTGDGSLDELAGRVWSQLDRIDGPLVLLCHSMGGLQARTFLLDDNRARRLRAIATCGSPHNGTSLASIGQVFQRALRDLTPNARTIWNAKHGEAERSAAIRHGVRCVSAVAACATPPRYRRMRLPEWLLRQREGPNDGLVSASSQRWGAEALEIDLDLLIEGAPPWPIRRHWHVPRSICGSGSLNSR